jgi:intracellular multiplication protein IcmK
MRQIAILAASTVLLGFASNFAEAQTPNAPRVVVPVPVTRPAPDGPPLVGAPNQVQNNANALNPGVLPPSANGNFPISALPPAMRQQISDNAFDEAMQDLIPTTPAQIRRFRGVQDETQRALLEPIRPQPKRVFRSEQITLDAGKAPPVLRVVTGRASALTFRDSTGAPWPVEVVYPGSATAFSVEPFGTDSSMLGISPLQNVINSNMIVRLRGLPTPVVVEIETTENEIDGRLDLHVLNRGPNARASIVEGVRGLEPGSAAIIAFLDGVPPNGSQRVDVSGFTPRDTAAWLYGGSLYIRTSAQVLSPAAISTVRSADDRVAVYEMPEVPIVLLSTDGQMGSLRLQQRTNSTETR